MKKQIKQRNDKEAVNSESKLSVTSHDRCASCFQMCAWSRQTSFLSFQELSRGCAITITSSHARFDVKSCQGSQ